MLASETFACLLEDMRHFDEHVGRRHAKSRRKRLSLCHFVSRKSEKVEEVDRRGVEKKELERREVERREFERREDGNSWRESETQRRMWLHHPGTSLIAHHSSPITTMSATVHPANKHGAFPRSYNTSETNYSRRTSDNHYDTNITTASNISKQVGSEEASWRLADTGAHHGPGRRLVMIPQEFVVSSRLQLHHQPATPPRRRNRQALRQSSLDHTIPPQGTFPLLWRVSGTLQEEGEEERDRMQHRRYFNASLHYRQVAGKQSARVVVSALRLCSC